MSAPTSPTTPIIPRRPKSPRFDGRLSSALDWAQVQLEAADEPEVAAVFRRLVDELERIAMQREVPTE